MKKQTSSQERESQRAGGASKRRQVVRGERGVLLLLLLMLGLWARWWCVYRLKKNESEHNGGSRVALRAGYEYNAALELLDALLIIISIDLSHVASLVSVSVRARLVSVSLYLSRAVRSNISIYTRTHARTRTRSYTRSRGLCCFRAVQSTR